MTATESRRRRKAERPTEILEAAFEEFSRNGYAATTLDQVAQRAGVTKGTIYVYFESKEHLFISMMKELTKPTMDSVMEMFERHEGSTADLLRDQFGFIYRNIVDDGRRREVVRMLIAEAPRFPELSDRYHEEIHRPCFALLERTIQRGIERGEIRPSAVVDCPKVIIAPIALVDLWLMMFADRHPLELQSYFEAHLEMVLNCLLVKSPADQALDAAVPPLGLATLKRLSAVEQP
jgi:AcrR family transcriptional regulator